jgi:hypothetical protein
VKRGFVIISAGAACLLASNLAEAEPCRPHARIGGDEAVVARVATELERLGISVERIALQGTETVAPAACPTVIAMVQADAAPDSILVAVRGSSQASEGRVVSDATVAAAWIDSWLADDAVAAAWIPSDPVATTVELAPPSPPMLSETPPGMPGRGALERFGVSVNYALGSGDEESDWAGFSLAACGALGKACLGGRIDATFESERDLGLTGMKRRDIALLATASRTVPLGRARVAVEAAAGMAIVTTARAESCKETIDNTMMPEPDPGNPMEPEPDPTNPDGSDGDPGVSSPPTPGEMCVSDNIDADGAIYVGDNFSNTSISPRAGLAMRLDIPIADWLWLEGRAGLTLSPLAHTDAFTTNPDFNDANMWGGLVDLPGEPLVRAELGIGVRVGLP